MMNITYKMILGVMASVLILGVAPKIAEAKQLPSSEKVENQPDLLSYPDNKDLEEQEKGHTPSEQEKKLQEDEDNVMNVFPD